MIVVDTNVIAYLYFPGRFGLAAERLLTHDPAWSVPRLWRSEFRNVLATQMRNGTLTRDAAIGIFRAAESVVAGSEYDVTASDVLRLAERSGCPACDCEFVALAEHLDVRLVSQDARLCRAFPGRAMLLSATLPPAT